MEYLWKFIWKFGAFAMLIVVGNMGVTQAFSVGRLMEAILLFLIGPMLIGYIELKGGQFSETVKGLCVIDKCSEFFGVKTIDSSKEVW